jgi:hypothetical protein
MSAWSAMHVSAEFIPRIPSSRMKWWRKPPWKSAWMNSPAGVSELFLKLIREKSFKIQEAYRRIASGHAQYDQRAARTRHHPLRSPLVCGRQE